MKSWLIKSMDARLRRESMNNSIFAMARTSRLTLGVALISTLLVAGCGGAANEGGTASGSDGGSGPEGSRAQGSSSTSGVPQETGLVGITETDAEPRRGGTLTMGVWAEARGLDPAKVSSAGVAGGMENLAIYSALMRYDPRAGEYEPLLAKSLEHSEDYLTWTLRLRDGVMFSDGTALNAEAVVFSFDRARGEFYDSLVSQIASMETPDERTVVFKLKEPWSKFPWMLSMGPGRVPSPTAVRQWGEDFGKHPVGAGPFVLDHWAPGEELVLTANENFWGDGPYLDSLRFVPFGGDHVTLDTLNAGDAQMAFLRAADIVATAREAGYGGFANVVSGSTALAINNAEGRPGADPRIRKAIAYAINTDQLNQRVLGGKGLLQKNIMAEGSPWATDTSATPYSVEKAKALVAEAKADGFDGAINLASSSSRLRKDMALALQAQLNAVGFETSIDYAPSSGALYGKMIEGSFDVGFYAVSVLDAVPWFAFKKKVTSEGGSNYMHYANPKMDRLVNQLHDSTTDEDKQLVLNKIQTVWAETVPMVPLGAVANFVAWDDSVHGIVPTAFTGMLFSRAWLSK